MSIKEVQKYSTVAVTCKQEPTAMNNTTVVSLWKEESSSHSVTPVETK